MERHIHTLNSIQGLTVKEAWAMLAWGFEFSATHKELLRGYMELVNNDPNCQDLTAEHTNGFKESEIHSEGKALIGGGGDFLYIAIQHIYEIIQAQGCTETEVIFQGPNGLYETIAKNWLPNPKGPIRGSLYTIEGLMEIECKATDIMGIANMQGLPNLDNAQTYLVVAPNPTNREIEIWGESSHTLVFDGLSKELHADIGQITEAKYKRRY